MEIRQITEDKDNYLEMLLIADPQENMIRRYLDKSDMFVLEDAGEVLTIGVVEHMKESGHCTGISKTGIWDLYGQLSF